MQFGETVLVDAEAALRAASAWLVRSCSTSPAVWDEAHRKGAEALRRLSTVTNESCILQDVEGRRAGCLCAKPPARVAVGDEAFRLISTADRERKKERLVGPRPE